VDCFFYSDDEVGYLVPVTGEVRPIPGREEAYRAALPGLRANFPEYTFADPR
jgi:hypothetical protein